MGIPLSWPYIHSDTFYSLMVMAKPGECHMIHASSGPIDQMRNLIATKALEKGCTHLIFLDADMTYPIDTIPRLLESGKEIVGALCFKRWPPFTPTIMIGEPESRTFVDDYPEGLIKVSATGTGCLLIDCRVFEEMPYPWFEFKQTENGSPIGEDIHFCDKARALGYSVYVDTRIKTGHLTITRANESWYRLNRALIAAKKGRVDFVHEGPEWAPQLIMEDAAVNL